MAEQNDEEKQPRVDIRSIVIDGRVTASLAGLSVRQPNWKPGITLRDGHGSKRPGVFIITEKPERGLRVKIAVEGLTGKEDVELVGKLKNWEFSGKINASGPPVQTVHALPKDIPGHFKRVRGDMTWYIKEDGEEIPVGPGDGTRLEMYWIYGYPGKMYKKGVWIEVLRLLAVLCYFGLKETQYIIQRVVNYCHAGTTLKYDSWNFSNHYVEGEHGGSFDLRAFLQNTHPLCNCYDQAGAVQTLLGAIGIHVDYAYMQPFGFLKRTSLIGRGAVNNTIFLGRFHAPELLPGDSPQRGGFDNHAFCLWEKQGREVVLDATAGPHVGMSDKKEYVERSIDHGDGLYPTQYMERPGEVKDIKTCGGVTDLDSVTDDGDTDMDTIRRAHPEAADAIQQFGLDQLVKKSLESLFGDYGVVMDWPDTINCQGLDDGSWNQTTQVRGGAGRMVKEWVFDRDGEHVKIKISVSNEGINAAINFLLTHIAATPFPGVPFKKSDRSLDMPGYLHVSGRSQEAWLYYNVFCVVEAQQSPVDLDALAHWMQQPAAGHVKEKMRRHLPAIDDIRVSPALGVIGVDQKVSIRVYPEKKEDLESLTVEFFHIGESLRFVNEKKYRGGKDKPHFLLEFRGQTAGPSGVTLVLTNRKNLLCSLPRPVPVIVIPKKKK